MLATNFKKLFGKQIEYQCICYVPSVKTKSIIALELIDLQNLNQ